VFWYDAPTKIDLPFNIVGLLAFEFFAMHFVELKRWQDFRNPGSVDADPLFPSNKLKPHEVRHPWGLFSCDFDLWGVGSALVCELAGSSPATC
jgi:light-harvesting complex I chlorophyll a/b binding protein 4